MEHFNHILCDPFGGRLCLKQYTMIIYNKTSITIYVVHILQRSDRTRPMIW